MMKIVLAGGGIIGLSAAMLLARDGQEVVVIERDPAPLADPTVAWDDWDHRGVTQVRMAHHFASRFRVLVERELPMSSTAWWPPGPTYTTRSTTSRPGCAGRTHPVTRTSPW